VLARTGQTEAAVDLARLAGLHPSGVICEIMNKDGTMARVPQLRRFARRHDIPLVAIADLIAYRMRTESVVTRVASTKLPTEYGEFRLHAFENQIDKQTHVALVSRRGRKRAGRTRPRTLTMLYGRCFAFGSL